MRRLPLAQIRLRYVAEGRPLDGPTEAALRSDSWAGARAILDAIDKRRFDNRSEGQRLRGLLRFKAALWGTGVERVAGVDEAGMSPMAGPVAAAAVMFRPGSRIPGVDDSKKLDASERDRLAGEIRSKALAYSGRFRGCDEIDTINIYWAGILAMRRAVEGLTPRPLHLLIDARRIRDPQQPIVKGDCKSQSIAAASILAKTARDALMLRMDEQYPGYGFARARASSRLRASTSRRPMG